MRSLSTLSGRSLLRRKARYLLTGSGVALGVAVLFGVLVATGATTQALDELVRSSAGRADVFIRPVGNFDAALPPGIEQQVSALPEVEEAVGSAGFRSFVQTGEQTEVLTGFNIDAVFLRGLDLERAARVHDFDVAEGRLFDGPDQVVLARAYARGKDIAVGDQVRVATPAGLQPLTVTGLLHDQGAGAANNGDIAYTDLATARRLHGQGEVLTNVDVVLAPEVDVQQWIEAHRPALGTGVSLQDADDLVAGFREFIVAVNNAMTLLSAVALFVGGFLIFLTFSLAVAERTRIFGTLRALGALPRQVRRVVVTEAVILAAAASVVGLVLGYGLAAGAIALFEGLLDLRMPSPGVPVGSAVIAVVGAVIVSVVAAWLPGRRAAALGPVAAMREGAAAQERQGRPWLGLALLLGGLGVGFLGPPVGIRSISSLVVLLGAVLLVPFVLQPLSRVLGALTGRLARGVGAIAVMHLAKERSRSAYTLGLVMVVLAMLIGVGAANQSMSQSLDVVIERQAGGNLQIIGAGSFEPEVDQELAAVPGTDIITPLRVGETDVVDDDGASNTTFMAVIDPQTYFEVASFAWIDGDDASAQAALARGGAVLLPEAEARRLDTSRGETVRMRTSQGVEEFEVAATYGIIGFGFGAVVSLTDGERFGGGRPNGYLVGLEEGVDPEATRLEIFNRLGDRHQLFIDTTDTLIEQANAQLAGFFGMAYTMLFLAAVTGLMGLANTLVVSVITRTREIGMLRSNGALRRQVRGMVLVEAATLTLAAFVLAVPLGAVISGGIISGNREALGVTLDYVYPWGLVIPLGAVALLVAGLASLVPARRAGRLEPVAALRFD